MKVLGCLFDLFCPFCPLPGCLGPGSWLRGCGPVWCFCCHALSLLIGILGGSPLTLLVGFHPSFLGFSICILAPQPVQTVRNLVSSLVVKFPAYNQSGTQVQNHFWAIIFLGDQFWASSSPEPVRTVRNQSGKAIKKHFL